MRPSMTIPSVAAPQTRLSRLRCRLVNVVNDLQPSSTGVANRLRPVLLKLGRELRREVHPLGVTGGQVSLLAQIRIHPGIGVRGLAARERISAGGDVRARRSGSSAPGSSSARPHPGDLRRQGLDLTAAGERVLRSVRSRRTAWLAAAPEARCSPEELARSTLRSSRSSRLLDEPTVMPALPGAQPRAPSLSLRRHRNYRLFFAGQLVSLVGTWMQNVALAWFVVELTRSPVAVGLLAFCRFVPFTVLGLFAGVLADRFDNRRLVMATQSSQMLVSIALAALAFSGVDEVWHVYAARARSAASASCSTRPVATRSRSRWSAATSCRTPSR